VWWELEKRVEVLQPIVRMIGWVGGEDDEFEGVDWTLRQGVMRIGNERTSWERTALGGGQL
jgi:hypothetical protein